MSLVHRHIFIAFVGDPQLGSDGGAVECDECIASYGPKPWRFNGDDLLMTDRLTNCLAAGLLSLLKAADLVVEK